MLTPVCLRSGPRRSFPFRSGPRRTPSWFREWPKSIKSARSRPVTCLHGPDKTTGPSECGGPDLEPGLPALPHGRHGKEEAHVPAQTTGTNPGVLDPIGRRSGRVLRLYLADLLAGRRPTSRPFFPPQQPKGIWSRPTTARSRGSSRSRDARGQGVPGPDRQSHDSRRFS